MADIVVVAAPLSTQRKPTCVLFFFFVFVWRSEALCPIPHQGGLFVLSRKSSLIDRFPEGCNVSMVCRFGYEVDGGSDTITCLNGSWTELTLRCKRRNCGRLKAEPNMSFNTTDTTLFGDIIKVTCNEGYEIEGSSYMQCMNNGWFGEASCLSITCQKPAQVTNGKSLWDSQDLPKYGEVIQYKCDEGYTLSGNSSIVCSNHKYDSLPPECKAITCQKPAQVTNGKSLRDSRDLPKYGEVIQYKCDEGYTLSGNSSIVCKNGEYDSLPPECKEKKVLAADTNKDADYLPIVISVGCVTLGVGIVALCLHRHLKKKGSYDTRVDLKPKLFHFQNV